MQGRRQFLAAAAAGAATLAVPQKLRAQIAGTPLKIVFPFSAGGGGDAVCRLLGEHIGPALAQPIVVENKTGADGRIGIQSVKNAPADGNTVLITTGPTMWLYPLIHANPGYDPHVDFAPISQLCRFEFCVAVATTTGLTSMAEMAAWMKANPEKAAYGVPGGGTIPHFTGISLAKQIGVDMRRVPYRGGAPAINDLVGGQIPVVIGTLSDALQQHRAGTIRIIAVVSKTRSPFVPDIPTLSESGYTVVGEAWYGMWAPVKVAPARVAQINAAVTAALGQAAVKARLETLGLIPAPGLPEGLTATMKADAGAWSPIIKESGFRMEN